MEVELVDPHIIFQENHCERQYLSEFPIIDSNITYSEFFEEFLLKNQACLIRNISRNWNSADLWVENDTPNFSYLTLHYGDSSVSVEDCSKHNQCSQNKSKWKFRDYLKYWEEYRRNEYPKDTPLYYLKDWHLKNESINNNFYQVPLYFTSDWLNEYLVENSLDDYRFVYMGAKGTWTPFHEDVMTSYSWSTNICGKKHWSIFPPGEEDHLRDQFRNLPYDITNLNHNRKCFEIVQNPGDAIFVPTNWHHQVWNLKDTISINHNWFNGCNLNAIWSAMENNLIEVKEEIQDCKDMEDFLDHCQVMLRASFNMDFALFYDIILYITNKRIDLLNNGIEIVLAEDRRLGKNHALFDLLSVQNSLILFIKHPDVNILHYFKNVKLSPLTLLNNIKKTLAVHCKY